ncbi:MAG: 50S ribosomal protein L35 [Verrucomicrobia bacterium GWF2_51_19]|nr:MAG: 50S ribosomal protein L35 [Verrucomicrobia bacterium GWF2_51_19]HCJ11583.1 50S ribosomal protein L35 [Opitutae bacterium]
MQKTRKSIAKKYKVTGTGKILRRTAGKRHFMRNKTAKQKRLAGVDRSVSSGFAAQVRHAMPFDA